MNKSPSLLEPHDSSESLHQIADDEGRLSQNYLLLTAASCIIATLGLLENSVAVIIGAMIIAPMMGPIQAFAYAALDGDATLIRRSLLTAAAGGPDRYRHVGVAWHCDRGPVLRV